MEFLDAIRQGINMLFGTENQNILNALIILVVLDYITGICVAIHIKKLSSEIGSKGITRKVMIFVLISLSNIADTYFLQAGNTLETVTILFYCANEFISIIENAAKMGIPIPQKLRKFCSSIVKKS